MSGEIKGSGKRVAGFMAGLIAFTLLFAAASYMISVVMTNYFYELTEGEKMIPISAGDALPLLIIDPGHGGEDGGATSGEVMEKDLNLSVAANTYYLCTLVGIPVEMTRKSDTALYDLYGDLDSYGGKKKTYDLKNRVRFVKEEGGGVYLGIHMNKFPDPKYSGLQVYYSPNDGASEEFANIIRTSSKEYLQPENERETKRATSAIYVLDRITVPAVLVECGFVSNPDELSLLCNPGYRLRLAAMLTSSASRFELGRGY